MIKLHSLKSNIPINEMGFKVVNHHHLLSSNNRNKRGIILIIICKRVIIPKRYNIPRLQSCFKAMNESTCIKS